MSMRRFGASSLFSVSAGGNDSKRSEGRRVIVSSLGMLFFVQRPRRQRWPSLHSKIFLVFTVSVFYQPVPYPLSLLPPLRPLPLPLSPSNSFSLLTARCSPPPSRSPISTSLKICLKNYLFSSLIATIRSCRTLEKNQYFIIKHCFWLLAWQQ